MSTQMIPTYFDRDLNGLTEDRIRRAAPSIFAPQAHESRSVKYLYVPTIDLLRLYEQAGFVVTEVRQSRSRIEGKEAFTRHMLLLRACADLGRTLSVGDILHMVTLINSHDGTSSVQIGDAIYRLICRNGMMRPEGQENSLRAHHKVSAARSIVERTLRIVEGSAQVLDEVEEMKHIPLVREEQLLLAEVALRKRFDLDDETGIEDQTPWRPEQLLRARRREDNGNSLFDTLMKVQENTIGHNGGISRYDDERKKHTTREVKDIGKLVGINRTLYAVAQRMAEIKRGYSGRVEEDDLAYAR